MPIDSPFKSLRNQVKDDACTAVDKDKQLLVGWRYFHILLATERHPSNQRERDRQTDKRTDTY